MNNSLKTGKEITLGFMENDVRNLEHFFNLFVKLNVDTYKLNHLLEISLPGYSFDCFLKLSQVELDTIQDEKLLKNIISAIRVGICGDMGNGYFNNNSQSEHQNQSDSYSHNISFNNRQMAGRDRRSIWYFDANNLYSHALMQNLPYKDFSLKDTTLDEVLNTSGDSSYCYWVICDIKYTDECKNRNSKIPLLSLRREIGDNGLGYKKRPQKLFKK